MPIEPNITLLSVIELLGAVQGILFGSLLMFLRKGHRRANLLLGLMLFSLSFILFHQFLIDSAYIYNLPYLTGFTLPLEAFFGPLLFRYVQILTAPDNDISHLQRLKHFIAPVISTLLAVPFFLLSFEQKLNIIEQGYAVSSWVGLTKVTLPLQMAIFGIMFTVYLTLCFVRLYRHNQFISHYFSFREKVTLAWLRNLLVVMLVFWVLMSAFIALLGSSVNTNNFIIVLMLVTVVAIHYMGIMGLLQPPIFPVRSTAAPVTPSVTDKFVEPLPNAEPATSSKKYQHSGLTEADIERIAKKLIVKMENDTPYLENNLTLPDLAKMIGVSSNYLSQVLNVYFEMNFFDFINSYRIKFAENLLLKPEKTTSTVLDIAMASAFNSKSAFYSAFRKQTGKSPTEYRRTSLSR